jgi:hypothetical protein
MRSRIRKEIERGGIGLSMWRDARDVADPQPAGGSVSAWHTTEIVFKKHRGSRKNTPKSSRLHSPCCLSCCSSGKERTGVTPFSTYTAFFLLLLLEAATSHHTHQTHVLRMPTSAPAPPHTHTQTHTPPCCRPFTQLTFPYFSSPSFFSKNGVPAPNTQYKEETSSTNTRSWIHSKDEKRR